MVLVFAKVNSWKSFSLGKRLYIRLHPKGYKCNIDSRRPRRVFFSPYGHKCNIDSKRPRRVFFAAGVSLVAAFGLLYRTNEMRKIFFGFIFNSYHNFRVKGTRRSTLKQCTDLPDLAATRLFTFYTRPSHNKL
ncbi:hypothetical protein EV213_10693 [Aureibacillus halotolerans]|uniref:Uncharacterized protein n=1 Tax=Aureibacillus halotolerans TaxID=1508390 RepID=A0A4V3D5K1_9BACI|nr:hypothetical protein EV213_10693 [Aureibacillus halotolerans]